MKNRFSFKIVGSGPTGLLLSIALSKFDCNIFLTDLLTKDRLIDKDKTYAITHSTRKILSKFRLWEKLEPFYLALIPFQFQIVKLLSSPS